MSLGTLRNELATCCSPADEVYWFRGENIQWDLSELLTSCVIPAHIDFELDKLIESLAQLPEKRRHIVIMSNGSFGGIYQKLPTRLRSR